MDGFFKVIRVCCRTVPAYSSCKSEYLPALLGNTNKSIPVNEIYQSALFMRQALYEERADIPRDMRTTGELT